MTTLVPQELITGAAASKISNDSGVAGANVDDALNTLDGASDLGDQGTPIASAATTNIGAADSSFVFITGTTTITSFGTTTTRNHMWLKFAGALTLTNNGTSLILPTGANIITEADDRCEVIRLSSGAGNWIVVNYERADGTALDLDSTVNIIGSIGGGTQDIDLDLGKAISGTVDTSTTTFTFSNPKATGNEDGFVLYLTNGGSQTVNWPASVDWAGGTAPTLTTAGFDLLVFTTVDGGTIWHGALASGDSK